jgi:hypothetical protein
MKYVLLAGAILAAPMAAQAATVTLTDVGTTAVVAANDLGLGLNGTVIDYIDGAAKSAANGLRINGPAKLTFTYLGSEAGNTNFSATMGGTQFTEATAIGTTSMFTQLAGGLIDLSFGTSAPAGAIGLISNAGAAVPVSANYAIGYVMNTATSYFLLFDDIASGDRDFDDFAVRVDVAAVPLPAAGLMLFGALGGLAALRRRRAAA